VSAPSPLPLAIDHCWSRIGVKGDQSCPRLTEFVHCHNCAVFADAAQLFLDRPLPEGYVGEMSTLLLESDQRGSSRKSFSVVVCEVEQQLFALETKAVLEVTEPRNVHRIGQRTGRAFLGLVNIHGQLELCASLKGLLKIGGGSDAVSGVSLQPRMVLVEFAGQRWVFPVDAVHGVQRFDDTDVFAVPATARHDEGSLVSRMLRWNDRHVGMLDIQKAISSLDKSLQ
jgi:chemotaxis-related protein WspD